MIRTLIKVQNICAKRAEDLLSEMNVFLPTDSGLYKKVLECDHAQSRGTEGAWLSELREVFIEEVKERGSLPNDCK